MEKRTQADLREESVCAEHQKAEAYSMCECVVCLTGRGSRNGVTVRVNPRQQLSFMEPMN